MTDNDLDYFDRVLDNVGDSISWPFEVDAVRALVAEVRAERAKLEKVFQYCLDAAYGDINPYEIADLIGRGDELASKRDAVFDD